MSKVSRVAECIDMILPFIIVPKKAYPRKEIQLIPVLLINIYAGVDQSKSK